MINPLNAAIARELSTRKEISRFTKEYILEIGLTSAQCALGNLRHKEISTII
jgi:hypothetical protein